MSKNYDKIFKENFEAIYLSLSELETYLFKKGEEIGEKRGIKKGQEKKKIEMIKAFIKIGKLSLEEIATAAKVPLDYVVEIANS